MLADEIQQAHEARDEVMRAQQATRVIVQRVKNGYLVRVNRGETEVFTTVLEVFDRLRAVL